MGGTGGDRPDMAQGGWQQARGIEGRPPEGVRPGLILNDGRPTDSSPSNGRGHKPPLG